MRFLLEGGGATLLIAIIAATVWYNHSSGKVNDGVMSERASASTPNILLAVAHQPKASSAAALSDIKSLAARCQTAMIKDVCGIMTSGKSAGNGLNAERLFIAGVGEVDSGVFNRLREAGDKMCGEVETECSANWAGEGCKIARALYPV